ncbi:MAG: hypothetical protein M3R55_14655, partial [Acidobacteriota bacterium]|nr:hypothetical protein [Acidobacteriota bacterium]
SHVLEHVESPRAAVLAMRRVSRRWLILGVPNLLRPANWVLRRARYVNRGHLHGWDIHHFMTFLESGCGLAVSAWWADAVTLPPLRRVVDPESRALAVLERGVLPRLFPHMMNTLVVLCDADATPGSEPMPGSRTPTRRLEGAAR